MYRTSLNDIVLLSELDIATREVHGELMLSENRLLDTYTVQNTKGQL